jgi:hypothetical protein
MFKNGNSIFFCDNDCLEKFNLKTLSRKESKYFVSQLEFKNFCRCPLSGEQIFIPSCKHKVEFQYGQKIYMCCAACAATFKEVFLTYVAERITVSLPNMNGMFLFDPVLNAPIVISARTPKLSFKHGQAIYFNSFNEIRQVLTANQNIFKVDIGKQVSLQDVTDMALSFHKKGVDNVWKQLLHLTGISTEEGKPVTALVDSGSGSLSSISDLEKHIARTHKALSDSDKQALIHQLEADQKRLAKRREEAALKHKLDIAADEEYKQEESRKKLQSEASIEV